MAGITKLVLTIALTLAITLAVTTTISKTSPQREDPTESSAKTTKVDLPPKTPTSRFLAQNVKPRNPNAADHCHKNPQVCTAAYFGNSTTCCNNKCVDLQTDNKNCGACKNKCKFSQACCRGECVYLSYDKRHCGQCNFRCPHKQYCVYALCNYA